MQTEQPFEDRIKRMQLKWYGHILKMENSHFGEDDLPMDTAR